MHIWVVLFYLCLRISRLPPQVILLIPMALSLYSIFDTESITFQIIIIFPVANRIVTKTGNIPPEPFQAVLFELTFNHPPAIYLFPNSAQLITRVDLAEEYLVSAPLVEFHGDDVTFVVSTRCQNTIFYKVVIIHYSVAFIYLQQVFDGCLAFIQVYDSQIWVIKFLKRCENWFIRIHNQAFNLPKEIEIAHFLNDIDNDWGPLLAKISLGLPLCLCMSSSLLLELPPRPFFFA